MRRINVQKVLVVAFIVLTTKLAFGQKTILDISYNKDYVSEQGWTVWQKIYDENLLPDGFGFLVDAQDTEKAVLFINNTDKPVWLGGESRMKDDFWFTYSASGLKIGATYNVEANITMVNTSTCISISAWEADNKPDSKTVEPNKLTANGDIYSITITATSTNMTFGIGTGASNQNANDHYARNTLNTWKITENALEEYAITYHNVGSKNFTGNPTQYNISSSDISLETPNDSLGYLFDGWYKDSNYTNAISTPAIAQGSTGAKNFYAKWEAANLSGEVGIAGIPKSGRTLTAIVDRVENNTGILSYQWKTGDGSTFSNINGATASSYTLTNEEVGKYILLEVTSSTQKASLTSVIAQPVLSESTPTYVITYDANGGTDGYIATEEIKENGTALLSANPSHEGYELKSWNTKADGTGEAFSTSSIITDNITVYAQWQIITYTVAFEHNGSYASKTTNIELGRKIEMPTDPSKNGFTFNGWNTQEDGRGTSINANTIITSSITVYAQWNYVSYTVNFDADGTYATKETNIDQGFTVILPEPPTKDGFTFKNWNTQADGLGTVLSASTVLTANLKVYAQWREIIAAIPVAVNLNMKHSVDGVSDFGRKRHITSHTSNTESDWTGHEEMMDYFFNELDVYGGRDNGSSGWKNKMVTEDPNKTHWPDFESIKKVGSDLKKWYESEDFMQRNQFENRRGNMIMGLNPHGVYPSMDWTNHGKMNSGWQTYDVDAAAYFVAHYLDQNFAKSPSEIGEPLPLYWECMNEPDMAVMSSSAMFLSSFEKIYEFHNLSAIEIRNVLGDYAPKIGGFTWGQHDLWAPDLINRWANAESTYYQYSAESIYPAYDNMWLGYDGKGTRATGATLYQARKEGWWQWDALYQEFMETCSENLDFYSIHLYDWPLENDGGVIRAGGTVEATLDMIESYDIDRFGTRKDIVVSEFGTVSGLVDGMAYKRRDWENLRPFNQMFMQFLERPSHLVLTMPFAPVKAIWGDWWNEDGSLSRRYPSTMMDPVGDYRSPGYDHEEWEWSGMILWYELWKDVKGIRIDTKSQNPDIQTDAYVDGKHVYLILNNLELAEEYIKLNMFDKEDNQVKQVTMTHQYLDTDKDLPVNDITTMANLPAQVKIKKSATIIMDIEYENELTLSEESKETKYVSERLSTEKNRFGRDKYYVEDLNGELSTHINNVDVPIIGEATLRIGLRLSNGIKANIAVNGTSILTMTNQSPGLNIRGRELYRGAGGYFGVIEVDVPLDILKKDNEITLSIPHFKADISSVQLQVWDMTTTPGRFDDQLVVAPVALDLVGEETVMEGTKSGLEAVFTPSNTTNKLLEWESSNPSVISVDQFGNVTANASAGSAEIIATSAVDGSIYATKTISATAYQATAVGSIQIIEGDEIEIPYYINTQLNTQILPENATNQDVTWTSSNEAVVWVSSIGKVTGKQEGASATITTTVTDGGTSYSDSIVVSVKESTVSSLEKTEVQEPTLYPNPTNGTIYFSGTPISKVNIYTLTGALVMSKQINGNSLDCTALENGVYVIELSNNEITSTQKLVIQH